MTSNVMLSDNILRNHFRGVGGQGDDYIDYSEGGVKGPELGKS